MSASFEKILSPHEVISLNTLEDVLRERIDGYRQQIVDILERRDDRLMVIVGPCSIHNVSEALEYATALKEMANIHSEYLLVIMRVYLEKPRTTVGWKGFVHDPNLDGSDLISDGLVRARKLLIDLNSMGIPCATEFLDVINCEYYGDLISWGCIGARTSESQTHRQMASGFAMPVGFKNGTSGSIKIAIDAIISAKESHSYLSIDMDGVVGKKTTHGNPWGHIVLRGGWEGPIPKPNYFLEDIQKVSQFLQYAGLDQNIVIDCSHGNSKKKHTNQSIVASYLADKITKGEENVVGLMLESHIHDGCQKLVVGANGTVGDLKPGISITDACIDLKMTGEVLEELAVAVKNRRHLVG